MQFEFCYKVHLSVNNVQKVIFCMSYVIKYFVECCMQNRHQKVFNSGLSVCAEKLAVVKIEKMLLIYSV